MSCFDREPRPIFGMIERVTIMEACRAIDQVIMKRTRWPEHILANDWRPVVCGNQVIYERSLRA